MLPVLLLYTPLVVGFGTLCGSDGRHLYNHTGWKAPSIAEPNTKIVMFGDQGTQGRSGGQPEPVLDLIRKWIGSDTDKTAIIHSGDFDYYNNPSGWINTINQYIPTEVPYYTTIGNHDVDSWSGYEPLIINRETQSQVQCQGDTSVNQYCVFRGVHMVLSGIGTRGSGHASYMDSVFSQNPSMWKICSWHKNQRLYQVGGKSDQTGYAVYDMCRVHGAIIHTSHEHSYSRTKNMRNFAVPVVANEENDLTVAPEQTFAFVSGLGGKSIRSYDQSGTSAYPGPLYQNVWYKASAASNTGVGYGTLLCTFHVDGQPNKAVCEYPDINSATWDSFTIYSQNSPTTPSPSNSTMVRCSPPFLEFPITSSEADQEILPNPSIKTHHHTLSARDGKPVTTQFTFNIKDAVDGKRIQHIYLQVMGSSPNTESIEANMSIFARSGGPVVRWGPDTEGFEKNEVWVSPDLKYLVEDAKKQKDWKGMVTLTVVADGEVPRTVYSYDSSKCLAPTLTIELESEC